MYSCSSLVSFCMSLFFFSFFCFFVCVCLFVIYFLEIKSIYSDTHSNMWAGKVENHSCRANLQKQDYLCLTLPAFTQNYKHPYAE